MGYHKIHKSSKEVRKRRPPGARLNLFGIVHNNQSDRNHQHLERDGHYHCPHLTLLPLRQCCIVRTTTTFCKTPGRFIVVAIVGSGTNVLINNPLYTRSPTPRLNPNPNPHILLPEPQRRGSDCDTRSSRPKPRQGTHHRFQYRDRRPRAPLRRNRLGLIPALQEEEARTSRLQEYCPATADEPFHFEYHQKIL